MSWVVVLTAFAAQSFAQCTINTLPVNGANNVSLTPTLKWNNLGATQYDIFLGVQGTNACNANAPAGSTFGGDTEFEPPPLQAGTTYEWRVRPMNGPCANVTFACQTFTTSTASCPATPPIISSPANNAVVPAGNVTLQWSSVANATGYEIFLGLDGDAPSSHGFVNGTSKTIVVEPGRTVQWWVAAAAPNCNGLASPPHTFTTTCPANGPVLQIPPDGTSHPTNHNITFAWFPVAGAAGYDLKISRDNWHSFELLAENLTSTSFSTSFDAPGTIQWEVRANFDGACAPLFSQRRTLVIATDCGSTPRATLVSPPPAAANVASPVTFDWNPVSGAIGYRLFASIDGAASTQLAQTTNSSATVALSGNLVMWSVQTLFSNDCTSMSEVQRFTLAQGATCGDAPPTLLAPANGTTNNASPTTFHWTAVPGATRYSLFVAVGDDDFDFYGSTASTSLQRIVASGETVKWFVVAHFAACPDRRSAVSQFSTGGPVACPQPTISLLTPANNETVTSPVRLTWSAAPGVEFYRVWISVNGGPPVNLARTTAREATVNLPAGQMTWYVEGPRGEHCSAIVSEERRFTVARGANCDAHTAPTLVAPNGTTSTNVTLQWSAVPNAIGYRVWISDNGVAFEDVNLTRETSMQLERAPGQHVWFVQAYFDGCDPLASARARFTVTESTTRCSSDAPSVIAPANGATAASPVTFQWTGVAGAEKYRVVAQLNGGEPILLGVTNATQLTHELPPGVVDWGVEAVFDECPSTFSGRTRLTVPRAQNCSANGAVLVAPADNATDVTSPIDFGWNAVSGAVRYVLIVRVNDGAPTAIARTTSTSFTHAMPPGRIEWWVVTFFAACEPAESAHFRFTVARSQTCDNRKPILLLPRERGADTTSPVHFQWTKVPNATGYKVWLRQGENDASVIASTAETRAIVELPEGTHEWFVEAEFENCEPTRSARGEFKVGPPVPCGTPRRPVAQVVGQALSGTEYRLRWTPLPNVQLYEIQESTTPDFANARTFTTDDTDLAFTHEVTTTAVQYLYRVRGVSDCNDARGAFSEPVGVFVIPPRSNNASTEIGFEGKVVQKVFLPGSPAPLHFLATADKPWLTITPSEGVVPPEGITLTVTADPKVLVLGTNTGTIKVQYTGNAATKGAPETNAGTTTLIPLSVSLVTPVLPSGKGTPPPDSLIFAVVGHAQGANDSLFESDIRVTNLSATTMKYQLNFTPSGVNGTTSGSSSTVEIEPNATLALDDIVASLFGTGTTSSATGMLEVRPLTTSSSATTGFFGSTSTASTVKQLLTAASSRTYNFTPNGTFGQFIPATRFSDFVGRATGGAAPSILSLQQVAQSSAFRANFGFAEGSGKPADLMVRVYDTQNTLLKSIPVSLQAGEHKQINGMLTANGIDNLPDGRVEVEVIGGDGKVTAYVSEVDNETNDPLLVSPVVKGATSATRYVLPGVAYIQNNSAFWVTDVRIFNAGSTSTPATLTFYPQGNPSAAITREVTIGAGEIEVINNVIGDLFAQPNGAGGAIVVTTPTTTKLTASARTYNKTAKGTYGQYIPGVTPAEAVGVSDRALQLLQLEQSSRLRTNIGLSETLGQGARVEVSVIVPDQLATPVVTIDLQPNEFRQITLGPGGFGLDSIYNARVTVKVVSGNGRVTAYGSAIDLITQDPTYVPAQ
jgi:hypothetical protein